MPSVLFVCVANTCRSQMAEAAAKSIANSAWDIWSAGSHPSGSVHPTAIAAMAELELDLSGHRSKGVDQVPPRIWDYVITMGCGDACPHVPARQRLDWQIPDPVGRPMEEVRRVRDDILERVRALITSSSTS